MNKYFKVFVSVLLICGIITVESMAAQSYVPVVSQNITSTVNTARFIMFSGVYVDNSGNPINAVFKLDTYTGNVWILEVKKDSNGKIVRNWVAIDNTPVSTPSAVPEDSTLKELNIKN